MDDLRNLAINVVAGVLLFVLGFAARQLYSWLRSLTVGRFWRPLAKNGVTLVIGSFAKDEFVAYEPSGVVGIGDLRALHELIELFGRARLTRFKIAYVNEVISPSGAPVPDGGDSGCADTAGRSCSGPWVVRQDATHDRWCGADGQAAADRCGAQRVVRCRMA
jgi:hypothetical protein